MNVDRPLPRRPLPYPLRGRGGKVSFESVLDRRTKEHISCITFIGMGSLLALLSFCSSVLLPFCSSVFLSFCLKNNNLFMSYQFKSLSPVPSVGEGEERYYVLSISCKTNFAPSPTERVGERPSGERPVESF